MGFEPKVLESITIYRKKSRRARSLLMFPFILAVFLGVALLLVTLLARERISEVFEVSSNGEAEYWLTQTAVFIKFIAALSALALVAGLGYNLYATSRYARARFALFVEQQTSDYGPTAADKFIEALGGAALGAGVAVPGLVILDDPAANAVAFESEEGVWGVGATAGLLEAGVSVAEANAIMAHELSHLLIGENVRAPRATDLEFQPSLLLVIFGTLCASSVLAAPANITYVLCEVACALAALAVLMLFYRSETFIVKLLNLAHQHDDILADSLAAKITRDPAALRSAIVKVEALAGRTGRVPGGTILSRYLFVTPPSRPGDYYRFTTRVAGEILGGRKQPRTWLLFSRPANRATRKLLEVESRMTAERLINIDLIEQGRWRALEDWSRD